ncbi:MAG TPA: hypothetical protein VJR02_29490 [Pyrinomonadaceae bacterium]|nr:hypothetical protein [Pyrinomonadaceae bacterium]
MWLKYVLIVSIVLLVTIANSNWTVAQRPDSSRKNSDLATRLIKDVAFEGQLWDVLTRVSFDYDVPVGLEVLSDEQISKVYRVELREGTIPDLMAQIISQNERYDWIIENGVVNVFPRDKYRDALLAQLLKTRIRNFAVDKNSDCWKLQNDLLKAPEIKAVISAHGMQGSGADFSGFYIPQLGRQFSLQVSDTTLKTLLNHIIRESPLARTWIISADNPSRTLSLRVTSRQHEGPH